jgi:hypothetical protein
MALLMGMLLGAGWSVMSIWMVNKADITGLQIIIGCWLLFAQSFGIVLYMQWMADDAKRKDKKWKKDKVIAEEKKWKRVLLKEAKHIIHQK